MCPWEDYCRHISPERGATHSTSSFWPFANRTHTHTHAYAQADHLTNWECNWIKCRNEASGQRRLVGGEIQYIMMLSYRLHSLITLVQHYKAAEEFRTNLMEGGLFIKAIALPRLCIPHAIPITPLLTAALCPAPSGPSEWEHIFKNIYTYYIYAHSYKQRKSGSWFHFVCHLQKF